MPLDLFWKEDIKRILASHEQATMRLLDDEYRRGALDMLRILSVAFGVTPALETWKVAEGKGER